jgi:tRNA threonylcarbamoyladenosine biosynthesis protein TsaB
MTPTLLAFDTSTERMSLALTGPDGAVRLLESAGGPLASAALVPGLMALLAEAGLALADVDAIAFGCGPGAFTGLRTACSVAQGLALGAGKPVLPVDSLLLVAEAARAQVDPPGRFDLWVAMDARMDEVYAAAYRWDPAASPVWQTRDEPALYTVADLRQRWQESPPSCVAGSALAVFGERLGLVGRDPSAADGAAAPGTRLLPEPGPRAAALARLVPQLWAQGRAVDAALALPVYLRDKVAQTTSEREALRLAREGAGSP